MYIRNIECRYKQFCVSKFPHEIEKRERRLCHYRIHMEWNSVRLTSNKTCGARFVLSNRSWLINASGSEVRRNEFRAFLEHLAQRRRQQPPWMHIQVYAFSNVHLFHTLTPMLKSVPCSLHTVSSGLCTTDRLAMASYQASAAFPPFRSISLPWHARSCTRRTMAKSPVLSRSTDFPDVRS